MHRMAICVSHYYNEPVESKYKHTLPRLLEMQVIATSLIKNFEFSLPPQNEKTRIYRKPVGMMLPMTEEEGLGAWMGLVVKSVE
jgi:hypothetical protein